MFNAYPQHYPVTIEEVHVLCSTAVVKSKCPAIDLWGILLPSTRQIDFWGSRSLVEIPSLFSCAARVKWDLIPQEWPFP